MTRKYHLEDTKHHGPTCQSGRSGAALRGEHITLGFDDFCAAPESIQCSRCAGGRLFAFLVRQATKKLDAWEPEDDPNGWISRDAALIAARRIA